MYLSDMFGIKNSKKHFSHENINIAWNSWPLLYLLIRLYPSPLQLVVGTWQNHLASSLAPTTQRITLTTLSAPGSSAHQRAAWSMWILYILIIALSINEKNIFMNLCMTFIKRIESCSDNILHSVSIIYYSFLLRCYICSK